MEENAALKAQLEDCHFQQHLFHCGWVAADRKSQYLMAQLEEAHRTYKQSTPGAEAAIKELKYQLEQARSKETRSYDEEIQRLKVELGEAHIERINAVNRLLHADKIMASLNLKLDETNKQRQQNSNLVADQCEEDPTWCAKASQTDVAELSPGNERKAVSKNDWCREQQQHTEKIEKLQQQQQQLIEAQKDLEQPAAKHKEDQDILHCETEELRAKVCTNEALKKKNEVQAGRGGSET